MSEQKTEQNERIMVRLSPETRKKLEAIARSERRSLSSQAAIFIDEGVEMQVPKGA